MVKPARPQVAVEIALTQLLNHQGITSKILARFTQHEETVVKGETKAMTTTAISAGTTSTATAETAVKAATNY